MVEGVADRLRQLGATGQPPELFAQPNLQGLHERTAALLTFALPIFSSMAANVALNRIEHGDSLKRLMCKRRLRGDVDGIEFPPRVPLACHSTRCARGTLGSLAQQKANRGG